MLPLEAWPPPPVRCETMPGFGDVGPGSGEAPAGVRLVSDAPPRRFAISFSGQQLSLRCYLDYEKARKTYSDIVLELDAPRRVKIHLLQGLAHHIVRLTLAGLSGLDRCGLVEVALVVDIKVAKSIAQLKDLILLELRKFPSRNTRVNDIVKCKVRLGNRLIIAAGTSESHLWSLRTFIASARYVSAMLGVVMVGEQWQPTCAQDPMTTICGSSGFKRGLGLQCTCRLEKPARQPAIRRYRSKGL